MTQYELLKDINLPGRTIKTGTIGDLMAGHTVYFGNGENDLGFGLDDIAKHPDWFRKVEPKEWDIRSFSDSRGGVYKKRNGGYYLNSLFQNNVSEEWLIDRIHLYHIHSVRRLSDGEVFTVGDMVALPDYYFNRISRFYIEDGELFADSTTNPVLTATIHAFKRAPLHKAFTEKDLLDAEQKAFEASRALNNEPTLLGSKGDGVSKVTECTFQKYPTFSDYKKR